MILQYGLVLYLLSLHSNKLRLFKAIAFTLFLLLFKIAHKTSHWAGYEHITHPTTSKLTHAIIPAMYTCIFVQYALPLILCQTLAKYNMQISVCLCTYWRLATTGCPQKTCIFFAGYILCFDTSSIEFFILGHISIQPKGGQPRTFYMIWFKKKEST